MAVQHSRHLFHFLWPLVLLSVLFLFPWLVHETDCVFWVSWVDLVSIDPSASKQKMNRSQSSTMTRMIHMSCRIRPCKSSSLSILHKSMGWCSSGRSGVGAERPNDEAPRCVPLCDVFSAPCFQGKGFSNTVLPAAFVVLRDDATQAKVDVSQWFRYRENSIERVRSTTRKYSDSKMMRSFAKHCHTSLEGSSQSSATYGEGTGATKTRS